MSEIEDVVDNLKAKLADDRAHANRLAGQLERLVRHCGADDDERVCAILADHAKRVKER